MLFCSASFGLQLGSSASGTPAPSPTHLPMMSKGASTGVKQQHKDAVTRSRTSLLPLAATPQHQVRNRHAQRLQHANFWHFQLALYVVLSTFVLTFYFKQILKCMQLAIEHLCQIPFPSEKCLSFQAIFLLNLCYTVELDRLPVLGIRKNWRRGHSGTE